jgi:dTDP-4-dehydrorhamnose reductase
MNDLKKQKILITGAGGQLGLTLKDVLPESDRVKYVSKMQLDITDFDAVRTFFEQFQPQVCINTAAYTAVDEAEKNPEAAFKINTEAVANLAKCCVEWKTKFIHISTDYVFDGEANSPYKETDKLNPQTVYGISKLAGEEVIKTSGLSDFAIIRTSWLYSRYGKNFYKTILGLSKERDVISVVNDQTGSPTYAPHLAEAILKIAEKLSKENSGIYHFSDLGNITWFDFAMEIVKAKNLPVKVLRTTSEAFKTSAKRPKYSVLDCEKIELVFGIESNNWKQGLRKNVIFF